MKMTNGCLHAGRRWLALLLGLGLSMARAAAPDCAQGLEMPAAFAGRTLLLFGEIHGTREAPAFVGRYLCAALAQPGPLLLGLEIPGADNQAAIDAYLASAGTLADRRALMATPHFRAKLSDGRSSVAMFELIELARRLRHEGGPVGVLAFDAWPEATRHDRGESREQAMAQNLRAAARPGTRLIVLAGNAHVSARVGRPGAPDYAPLGALLADLAPLRLNIDLTGGSHWTCRKPGDCGPQPMPSHPALRPGTSLLGLDERGAEAGFDGYFHVGPITPSPLASDSVGQ